jgi:hypothetical protein
MRYNEFSTPLVESVTKQEVESALKAAGYEKIKHSGNKLNVLVQIPDGAKKNDFRKEVLNDVLISLQRDMKGSNPVFNPDPGLSSLGGISFDDSPVSVVIKDVGKQGDKSAGVANEMELASVIQSVVDQYGQANVTFEDERGKKMTIKGCNVVDVAGRDTAGRKKADVVLHNTKGGSLPISIKKLDADAWESADTLFGARAKDIVEKLVSEGVVQLIEIGKRENKRTGESTPVYKLSKEIVVEPTPEEAMDAIFGSDLNPKGGVVVQTFKPEHFTQVENNIKVDAHAVITKKEDIPESHLMVWLIRNDSTRSNPMPGLRTLGATLVRGIGKKGTKDVILVDVNGNVVENPNLKKKEENPKSVLAKKPELERGSEEATRTKR